MGQDHFCTCTDKACPLHPTNHDKGCDPCIRKNLKAGEIPSCFFRLVSEDTSELTEYTLASFVDFYQRKRQTTEQA